MSVISGVWGAELLADERGGGEGGRGGGGAGGRGEGELRGEGRVGEILVISGSK